MKIKGLEPTALREWDDVPLNKEESVRIYAMPWDFNERWNKIAPAESTRTPEEHGMLRAAALLYEVTEQEEFTWTAKHPGENAPRSKKIKFFEALVKEIRTSGLTVRQIARLVKWSTDLATMTDDAIAEATADFLTEDPPETTPTEG